MKTFQTSREFNCTPEAIFAAIANPESLARWWGPNGLTNTFHLFEFEPGGKWSFVMYGSNGTNYPNESEFLEIVPDEKVVIRHICEPFFTLTIQISATYMGSVFYWTQEFDSEEVAERITSVVILANEENLDRLTKEVASLSI